MVHQSCRKTALRQRNPSPATSRVRWTSAREVLPGRAQSCRWAPPPHPGRHPEGNVNFRFVFFLQSLSRQDTCKRIIYRGVFFVSALWRKLSSVMKVLKGLSVRPKRFLKMANRSTMAPQSCLWIARSKCKSWTPTWGERKPLGLGRMVGPFLLSRNGTWSCLLWVCLMLTFAFFFAVILCVNGWFSLNLGFVRSFMLRLFLSWVGEWRFAENFRPDLTGIYDSQSNPLQCDQTCSGHYSQSPQHGCIVFFMCAKKPYIMTLQTPLHPPNNKVVAVYSDYSGNSGPKGPPRKRPEY